MDNLFSIGEYEIECSAMKIRTAYYPHVEIRVRYPNGPASAVTYMYDGCSHETEEQALADARRQADLGLEAQRASLPESRVVLCGAPGSTPAATTMAAVA